MFYEEMYAKKHALEAQLEEAEGQERFDILAEIKLVDDVLGIETEELIEDELVRKWDTQLDRGEMPDLFEGLPESVRRRMLGR